MNQESEIPGEKGPEENPDDTMHRELAMAGWQRAGNIEQTHVTKMNPQTGLFEPKEIHSKEEIEKEYYDKYGKHGFNKIQLVNIHVYKGDLGWEEDPYSFYVYMKKHAEE